MKYLLWLLLLFPSLPGQSQEGHRLEVKLDNYEMRQLYFARFMGGNFEYLDTIERKEEGLFIIEDQQALSPGVYTIVLKPYLKAIQILIDPNNQHLQMQADAADIKPQTVQFSNSEINSQLYQYLGYLPQKQREINEHYKALKESKGRARKKRQKQIDKCTKELRDHQESLLKKYTNTWLALFVQTDLELPFPSFKGSEEEVQKQQYQFRRTHFFDELSLDNAGHIHNPRYFNKLSLYIDRLIPPHPDSATAAIVQFLNRLDEGGKLFQYSLDHFVKKYEKPRIVGMDAVFVALIDRYHNEGKTPWLSEKRRNQLQKSARIYKKILIGKVAPDITVQKRSGQSISLHDIEAKLTVLFLWRPGCGHCKKASPILKSLYEKYQEQGVELLSLCTHLGESVKECWTYVDENELDDWINAVDPRHRSRFIYLYNAQRTPKIYVLDEDKKILIKDISANQLEGLIQRFLKEAEEAVPNP